MGCDWGLFECGVINNKFKPEDYMLKRILFSIWKYRAKAG